MVFLLEFDNNATHIGMILCCNRCYLLYFKFLYFIKKGNFIGVGSIAYLYHFGLSFHIFGHRILRVTEIHKLSKANIRCR